MENKTVMDVFKNNLLTSITAICEEDNDEEFAIQVLDVLLDKMWTKEEIINVINETLEESRCDDCFADHSTECADCNNYKNFKDREDMNANDDEHRRQFERDVL